MRVVVVKTDGEEIAYEADIIDALIQVDGTLRCVTDAATGAAYEVWAPHAWARVRYIRSALTTEPRRRGRRG